MQCSYFRQPDILIILSNCSEVELDKVNHVSRLTTPDSRNPCQNPMVDKPHIFCDLSTSEKNNR